MNQILNFFNQLSIYGVVPVLLLFILAVGIAIFIMQLSIQATIRSSLQDLTKFLDPDDKGKEDPEPNINEDPKSDDTLQ